MKKFYKSKTFWFAILFGVFSVAGLFGYDEYIPSEDIKEIVNISVAVIMLVLRFVTSKKITF